MRAKEFGIRLGEAMKAAGFSKLAFAREMQIRRKNRASSGAPPFARWTGLLSIPSWRVGTCLQWIPWLKWRKFSESG